MYSVKTNTGVDISAFCGAVTIEDNYQSLGRKLTFTFNDNSLYDSYTAFPEMVNNQIIRFYDDGQEIYTGTIVRIEKHIDGVYTITCFDNAFYLNKNEIRIQFTDVTIKDAIQQLCERASVPCSIDCDINTKVTKIYDGEVISKILDDLLKLDTQTTGVEYTYDYYDSMLHVNAINNLNVNLATEPLLSTLDITQSIENLVNNVVIIQGGEKQSQEVATVQDNESINKYGQFTHYEKIDDKVTNVQTVAQNVLTKLNKETTEYSASCLGQNDVRSGRLITIVGLPFLVTECTHNYDVTHTMEVKLIEWHGITT